MTRGLCAKTEAAARQLEIPLTHTEAPVWQLEFPLQLVAHAPRLRQLPGCWSFLYDLWLTRQDSGSCPAAGDSLDTCGSYPKAEAAARQLEFPFCLVAYAPRLRQLPGSWSFPCNLWLMRQD
eukprot:gene7082-184_t